MDDLKAFLITVLLAIVLTMFSLCWYQSSIERKLINEKFGTNYTTKEVFWGGETIKELLEGEKNRIELLD